MKDKKTVENEIHDLKVKRSEEWQKPKSERDYDLIESYHTQINNLKQEVKPLY